jgi:hypothetical protein
MTGEANPGTAMSWPASPITCAAAVAPPMTHLPAGLVKFVLHAGGHMACMVSARSVRRPFPDRPIQPGLPR